MLRPIGSLLCLALAVLASSPARAGNLGIANDYTEFSFSNSSRNGDSTGRVAIGGDATFGTTVPYSTNFAIGTDVSGGGNYLVVGGELKGNQAQVNGGGDASYGSKSITNLYFNGGGQGHQQSSPVDFAAAEAYIKSLSTTLAGQVATGTTTYQYGGITLAGSANPGHIVYFDVDGAMLSTANSFTINVPTTETVVINVSGVTDSMQNFGFFRPTGISETNILFNFYEATSLTLSSIEIPGTILTPLGTIHFNGGQINGSLIANSIVNDQPWASGESHYRLFSRDNLPDPTPAVPEPSSMGLIATAGLIAYGRFLRRRSKKA